jgi:hypothetical protein
MSYSPPAGPRIDAIASSPRGPVPAWRAFVRCRYYFGGAGGGRTAPTRAKARAPGEDGQAEAGEVRGQRAQHARSDRGKRLGRGDGRGAARLKW